MGRTHLWPSFEARRGWRAPPSITAQPLRRDDVARVAVGLAQSSRAFPNISPERNTPRSKACQLKHSTNVGCFKAGILRKAPCFGHGASFLSARKFNLYAET